MFCFCFLSDSFCKFFYEFIIFSVSAGPVISYILLYSINDIIFFFIITIGVHNCYTTTFVSGWDADFIIVGHDFKKIHVFSK